MKEHVLIRKRRYDGTYANGSEFIVPKSETEIVEEGKLMHNALSCGYLNNHHMEGDATIVIFKNDCGDRVDLLVDEERKKVIHGVTKYNGPVSDTAFDMIKNWAEKNGLEMPKDSKDLEKEPHI